MSFRLIVRLPGEDGLPGTGDCELASDAFALYRRLARTRLRVEEILDLRAGERRPITASELEAIAQSERRDRHLRAVSGANEGGRA